MDTALNGGAAQHRDLPAFRGMDGLGNADLKLHQVEPGDHRDGVLDPRRVFISRK